MDKIRLWLHILFALAAAVCAAVGIGMCIMAVLYMEWGRVLFYGFLAVLGLECAGYVVHALVKGRRKP